MHKYANIVWSKVQIFRFYFFYCTLMHRITQRNVRGFCAQDLAPELKKVQESSVESLFHGCTRPPSARGHSPDSVATRFKNDLLIRSLQHKCSGWKY